MKKTCIVLLSCLCITNITSCKDSKNKSVILFSNDANCYVEQVLVINNTENDTPTSLGYKAINSLKNEYISSLGSENVLLVDAGNHLQGRE